MPPRQLALHCPCLLFTTAAQRSQRSHSSQAVAAEDIQNQVYEVGKRHCFANLRNWFKAQYEVLLGQSQGPRMGTFIALYGIDRTRALIRRALAGEDLAAA